LLVIDESHAPQIGEFTPAIARKTVLVERLFPPSALDNR
jgi:excinuclease UvrABC helicase subunit UvrB